MLTKTSTNRITFNVNVQGTAIEPTARCVLGENPALVFPAVKTSTETFEVLIDVPLAFPAGEHKFLVEVLLNGRLFTPINTVIQVQGEEIQAPASAPEVPAPTPAPVPPPEPAKPAPSIFATVAAEAEKRPVKSLLAAVTEEPVPPPPVPAPPTPKPAAKPTLTASLEQVLAKEVQAPVSFMAGIDKLSKYARPKASKLSMADVANEAAKQEKTLQS